MWRRSIIHVDMDAFYASVELRDNPALGGLPVVVGGSPERRGVIAAASYAARKYGIHSAMPSKTAVRLCPELVFVPARHRYYAEISHQIQEIFERYTPLVEPIALDEAFLDVTACQRLHGEPWEIGRHIKHDIRSELDLTASVGVAPNKFVAKVASDLEKPDGMVVVPEDEIQSLLDPLPVSTIWGVGKSGLRKLSRLGVTTVKDLRNHPLESLTPDFGLWGEHIWRLANGLDDRPVVPDADAKSISHETTFAEDLEDVVSLEAVVLDLAEQVAARLRRKGRYAATVQIKLRYHDFRTVTRAHTMKTSTNLTHDIWSVGRRMLKTALDERNEPVRLLGIGVSGLQETSLEQGDLFDTGRARQRGLDEVTDRVNQRFGSRVLHRGLKS